MLNVFLIDDEYFERLSLKNSIPWKELGLQICGEANNGQTAYEMMMENPPDIAIVDINMPKLNGIDLISKLNDSKLSCKYIILTGYDEFKYAQKAIKLSVSDYILKPIDYAALIEALTKLAKEITPKREPLPAKEPDSHDLCPEPDSHITARVISYLMEHYADPELSIASIANALYLNYSYLCHCFKRDKHMTINSYIRKIRIEKAKELMEGGMENISFVAEKTGFTSASYFSKQFKKATGIPPSEYLKTKQQTERR